jgi:hypothetical protein
MGDAGRGARIAVPERRDSMRKQVKGALACVVAGLVMAMPSIAGAAEVVAWSAMAGVKEIPAAEGKTIQYPSTVSSLDGKVIRVKGFRIPLEVKTHFLVAAKPSDCETCIEGGPESYVEVFSKLPVQATFGKPLTVAGRLELLRSNPTGSYYRLVDASVVSVD